MLQTRMAPSSAVLRPYVWAYGMTTGRVDSLPLVIPLPARPKQLLTFSFADLYCVHRPGSDHGDASPRVTLVNECIGLLVPVENYFRLPVSRPRGTSEP